MPSVETGRWRPQLSGACRKLLALDPEQEAGAEYAGELAQPDEEEELPEQAPHLSRGSTDSPGGKPSE